MPSSAFRVAASGCTGLHWTADLSRRPSGARMCGSVRRRPAGQCGGRRWDALPGVPLLERSSNGCSHSVQLRPCSRLCILHTRCRPPSRTGTPLQRLPLSDLPTRRSFLLTKLWAAGRSMGGADRRCAAPIPAGASAEQKNNQAGLESRRVH